MAGLCNDLPAFVLVHLPLFETNKCLPGSHPSQMLVCLLIPEAAACFQGDRSRPKGSFKTLTFQTNALRNCGGRVRSGGGIRPAASLPGLHCARGPGPVFTRQKAPLGAAFVVPTTSRALPGLTDGPAAYAGLLGSGPGSGWGMMSEGGSLGSRGRKNAGQQPSTEHTGSTDPHSGREPLGTG